MASLAETIRLIATKQTLSEAGPGAMPSMQANQPTVGSNGTPPVNTGPTGGAPDGDPDLAGQQVAQAELILIADRSQKIAALVGQSGMIDPMMQTQITGIASDISQLYADLVLSMTPDPTADPNNPQGQQQQQASGGQQVNTNPKVAEEQEQLDEISNKLVKNYVRKSFTQLGGDDVDPDTTKKRTAGIRLAVDKAGGHDKLYGNASALGRRYGVPTGAVRVPTSEEEIKEADSDNDEDDSNEHIIMQLHKAVTLGGKKVVKFTSGQKVKVDPKDAYKAIKKFSMLKPAEKMKAQDFLRQSHNNLKQFVNEDFELTEDELQERVIKAEPHFIDQLEGSMNTSSGKEIEFENGQRVTIPPNIAKKIVEKFRGASAYDKQQLNKYVRASYANLIRASRG